MDKERQAVYRAMQQGLLSLADSFQIPRIDGHALSVYDRLMRKQSGKRDQVPPYMEYREDW